MNDVVILVPRRADGGHRDRLWRFSRAWWARLFPDWPIVEGYHDEGRFNRSAAINRAADLAGEWGVAIVIDADVLPDPAAVRGAVEIARSGRPAIAFDHRKKLTRDGTTKIVDEGYRGSWEPFVKHDSRRAVSGAYAVSRELWEQVGGFDELFVGWGGEDNAFRIATETLAGAKVERVAGDLWHLWHPTSPENNTDDPGYVANRDRWVRYKTSWGKVGAIRTLLAEQEPRVRAPGSGLSSTIPRILHRTVPTRPTAKVDGFWEQAKALHPSWVHLNHQDPLDPADWPETGYLWDRCTSGAQLAGLIRLEALYRWGGVYLDSDVEMFRPLDPLLGLQAFAGWESNRIVPDAVLGSAPGHPAFAIMLDLACRSVERAEGAWKSGPGVTTSTLPGRLDVLLLPPGSFYPIHFRDKARIGDRDHAAEYPYAFGLHHWHHSWNGH